MNAVITSQSPTQLPAWLSGISGALPDAITVAKTVIDAGFAPKDCKGPQSIVVAAAMGARLGLDFFSSIYGIAVINNRPSLYGDSMLAVCQNYSQWEDFREEWTGVKYNDDFTAVCSVKRKGRDWKTWDFCVKDAKHAGLWEKAGPWKTTPQRMLMMRARAFALRDVYADILAGFHSREEMEDTHLVDVTKDAVVHSNVVTDAKPAKIRKAAATGDTAAEIQPKAPEPAAPAPVESTPAEPVSGTGVAAPAATVVPGAGESPAMPEGFANRDLSVAVCRSRMNQLYFMNSAGQAEGKKIMTSLTVKKVDELGAMSDVARALFIQACEKAIMQNGGEL